MHRMSSGKASHQEGEVKMPFWVIKNPKAICYHLKPIWEHWSFWRHKFHPFGVNIWR